MTLKRRISLGIALLFSLLLGAIEAFILVDFAHFRKEEFFDRLEEKALTAAKLLLEVKEVDGQLLRLIDENTVNRLYNERTLIFDERMSLIYSSVDDARLDWDKEDLYKLKSAKKLYLNQSENEILGIYYDFEYADYYVIVAAEDKYGNSKTRHLFYVLLISFLVGVVLIWFFTYLLVKRLLLPLDSFQQNIAGISANSLHVHLDETFNKKQDEIGLLARAFNNMLQRLESSFKSQKEFTSNASHELRTPLTRIAFRLENLLQDPDINQNARSYLEQISGDVRQIADLVNSLLLLSKMSQDELRRTMGTVRIDEILFNADAQVKKSEPDFHLDFEIVDSEPYEHTLEVFGVASLLEIVFVNLLKNACWYSYHKKAKVELRQIQAHRLQVCISNQGQALSLDEQSRLFQPFVRGSNAGNTQGSGLGLRIVERILNYHQARITYGFDPDKGHCFCVEFDN